MIRLSGRFRSSLIIGLQGIRARKLRTLLSMVSLFLGVLAVVVVQAGAETAQSALLSDVELTMGIDGTRRMYAPPDPKVTPVVLDTVRGRADAVAVTSTQAIIGEPGVAAINSGGAPFDQPGGYGPYGGPPGDMGIVCDRNGCYKSQVDNGEVPPPGQAIELRLTAMTGDVRQFRPFRLVSGQWLDFSSDPSLSPRIVLNREAAKGFTRYRVPAEMRMSNATAGSTANSTPRIVGVADDGQQMPTAYVRADELLNWLPQDGLSGPYGGGMEVLMAPSADAVEQTLRLRMAAQGIPADRLFVEVINSKERVAEGLAILRWIFLGMAGLVLLIGVAGILNVGLATVGERVEEFALRRAVGTPRMLLAGIVLAETLLTGLLTAAAAIGVAAAALQAVSPLIGSRIPTLQDLTFPWRAAVAGIIAGLIAGLLGGLIPAIRAARIPIATVMRA